ncbi:hypothetical protein CROQUDRAFT_39818 [Cronartium quercuum f. sp. fusiforme G11]|uniref:CxC6 like cysteine cluster associated with KDZ domain-containing protein n=1 Tax=Cronartium quercuum f. sp. fusiforme G11 TaxID=708437 RepID=A0A9P6NSH0_9BASI|nr:hypothetical protein CROQUDRAFT_39818 [Cronartium quercuum f. sp. fusiforme G11]
MITNGITIRYWQCSASKDQLAALGEGCGPCCSPLNHFLDHFCPSHTQSLKTTCHAQPCTAPCVVNTNHCNDPIHQAAVEHFQGQKGSMFPNFKSLNWPGSHLPIDPMALINTNTYDVDSQGYMELTNVEEHAFEGTRDGGETSKHKKNICCSCCRTHTLPRYFDNAQLWVAPCGIVLVFETMMKSEGLRELKEMMFRNFGGNMPQCLFYNNNCGLYSHIQTSAADREACSGTIFPVDPFHFRGHADTHTSCHENNNPHLFPELKVDGKWAFNASAAEMTNVWFGKFDSMVRNMHATWYHFFFK